MHVLKPYVLLTREVIRSSLEFWLYFTYIEFETKKEAYVSNIHKK